MSRRRSNRPSGFVLLILLGLLAVATILIANAARILILENRQAQHSEDRQQAEWLAESALQRAAARLVADRKYQGETWQVSAADLGRPAAAEGGRAVISVETVADRPAARRVRVTANFPAAEASPKTNQVSRQIVFELPEGKAQPTSQRINKSQSMFIAESQP